MKICELMIKHCLKGILLHFKGIQEGLYLCQFVNLLKYVTKSKQLYNNKHVQQYNEKRGTEIHAALVLQHCKL